MKSVDKVLLILICLLAGIPASAQRKSVGNWAVPISVKVENKDKFTTSSSGSGLAFTSAIYSKYLDQKAGANRFPFRRPIFDAPNECTSEVVLGLDLNCYVVNNTDRDIHVNRIRIDVDNSTADHFPYMKVETVDDVSSTIDILNCNYENWKYFDLDYTILLPGQKFDGKYKSSRRISYFENRKTIDFVEDIKKLVPGYEKIRKEVLDTEYSSLGLVDIEAVRGNKQVFEHFSGLLKPYSIKLAGSDPEWDDYICTATVVMSIKFDTGERINYEGPIYLALGATGRGAGMLEEDQFDVTLKPSGKGYSVWLPFVTTISRGGSTKLTFCISAPRTSTHDFKVIMENNEGVIMESKPCRLNFFNPRNALLIQSQNEFADFYGQ